jgi:hypothetical protein
MLRTKLFLSDRKGCKLDAFTSQKVFERLKTEEFYTYKLFSIFRLVLHNSKCLFEYFCNILHLFFWRLTGDALFFYPHSAEKKSTQPPAHI